MDIKDILFSKMTILAQEIINSNHKLDATAAVSELTLKGKKCQVQVTIVSKEGNWLEKDEVKKDYHNKLIIK